MRIGEGLASHFSYGFDGHGIVESEQGRFLRAGAPEASVTRLLPEVRLAWVMLEEPLIRSRLPSQHTPDFP